MRLNNEHPYGSDVVFHIFTFMVIYIYGDYIFFSSCFCNLQKMERVGYIQKRLGKRLRDVKKKTFVDDSGQVKKIKWGRKGHLTETVINSLSVYFGGAIRNFPGDMDEIFRAL